MKDNLDKFVENLQEQIFNETREAFGEAGFQRWRNPRFNGKPAVFDARARVTGSCGDTMEIYLTFKDDRVENASYVTDGCGSSSICGSFTAEMAMGKDPDELSDITGEAVLEKIGCFPEEDRHCAFLAAATLQEALKNYMTRGATKKTPAGLQEKTND